MTRCPPLCDRAILKKEEKKVKKGKRVVTLEKERIVRWAIDNKEDWGRKERLKRTTGKLRRWSQRKF